MRSKNTVHIIAMLIGMVLLTSCCGLLSDGGRGEEDEGATTTHKHGQDEDNGEDISTDFEGTYKMVNEEYDDLSLEISDEGNYYLLKWGIPASEPWIAYGIRFGDYLCVSIGGEDGIVGIYQKRGSKLAGVWLSEGELIYDLSEGADELETSDRDFSGTWAIESPDPETDEVYTYTLTVESSGDVYTATEEFEEGVEVTGSALAVDDVIIMGFPVGGSLVTKVFKLRGSKLDGKTFYSYFDDEEGFERVVTGAEKGTRE